MINRPFIGITHTNRSDLLEKAVASCIKKFDIMLVDNSEEGYFNAPAKWGNLGMSRIDIIRPHQPLTYTQSMNLFRKRCIEQDIEYFFFLHEDAELLPDSLERMIAMVGDPDNHYWGVILSKSNGVVTDAFSAYNLKLLKKQKWDVVFPAYFGDTDYFYWAKRRGFDIINSDIEIKHVNSATIHSDPVLEFKNSVTYPLYMQYFQQKIGGSGEFGSNSVPFGSELFDWKTYMNS